MRSACFAASLTFLESLRTPSFIPPPRFGSFGRLNPLEREPGSALRRLPSAPPRLSRERTASAPASPARAAPPASNGVFARLATFPTLFAADPTLFAPEAAVSLTVPPTPPTVLWPFRERVADRGREVLALDDDDRVRELEEERRPDEPREVVAELRLEVDRPLEFVFARVLLVPFLDVLLALVPLFVPFLDPLVERLDERRLLVLVFACAIYRSSSGFSGFPFRLLPITRGGRPETVGSQESLRRERPCAARDSIIDLARDLTAQKLAYDLQHLVHRRPDSAPRLHPRPSRGNASGERRSQLDPSQGG